MDETNLQSNSYEELNNLLENYSLWTRVDKTNCTLEHIYSVINHLQTYRQLTQHEIEFAPDRTELHDICFIPYRKTSDLIECMTLDSSVVTNMNEINRINCIIALLRIRYDSLHNMIIYNTLYLPLNAIIMLDILTENDDNILKYLQNNYATHHQIVHISKTVLHINELLFTVYSSRTDLKMPTVALNSYNEYGKKKREELQQQFKKSKLKEELMANVWHPKNFEKFKHLDPDTFGEEM